jgi:dTDP-4-amino-4,6-dideoxygalactose transaminase
MSQPIKFPDPEKVKQRAQRIYNIYAAFDEQIAMLDQISAQIEAENQKQPFYIYCQRKKQEREAAQEKLHTMPASI